MKQHTLSHRISFTLVLALSALAPAAAQTNGNGADIAVPDLETRIRNIGNSIPSQAIPAIPAPAPATLPAPVPGETTPSAPEQPVEPQPAPELPAEPVAPGDISGGENAAPLSGFARLGAGSPGSLSGDLSLVRAAGDLPALALDFSYDSADGYGAESPGSGYFDRDATLGVRVSSDRADSDWFADARLTDRSDGFQNLNPRYYSFTRRDIVWTGGVSSVPIASSPFSFSATADGKVFTAFADGPDAGGSDDTASSIEDVSGYRFSPFASLAYERGSFSGELSLRYAYETVADAGETHDGEGTLALRYALRGFDLVASVGLAGDTDDGLVVPFNAGIVWNGSPVGDEDDGRRLSVTEAHLTGGISRVNSSPFLLGSSEPFADPSGLSANAADWNAKGGFTVESAFSDSSHLSFSTGAEFRKSLVGHGIFAVTDSLAETALVKVSRVNRSSLVTDALVRYSGDGFELSAGYSGEWLDRIWKDARHTASCGFRVFDRGSDRIWEAGIGSAFAIDRAEIPEVSASGTVSPFRNFSVTLSFDDALPLFLGEPRTRNGLYAERSGELALSAKIDF